jgi:hypothetical protein
VSGEVRAGASGGMGRKDKDSRRPGALLHVTNPTSRNREAARQIGSLLNTLHKSPLMHMHPDNLEIADETSELLSLFFTT